MQLEHQDNVTRCSITEYVKKSDPIYLNELIFPSVSSSWTTQQFYILQDWLKESRRKQKIKSRIKINMSTLLLVAQLLIQTIHLQVFLPNEIIINWTLVNFMLKDAGKQCDQEQETVVQSK